MKGVRLNTGKKMNKIIKLQILTCKQSSTPAFYIIRI